MAYGEATVHLCQQHNLLPDSKLCPKCGTGMHLVKSHPLQRWDEKKIAGRRLHCDWYIFWKQHSRFCPISGPLQAIATLQYLNYSTSFTSVQLQNSSDAGSGCKLLGCWQINTPQIYCCQLLSTGISLYMMYVRSILLTTLLLWKDRSRLKRTYIHMMAINQGCCGS